MKIFFTACVITISTPPRALAPPPNSLSPAVGPGLKAERTDVQDGDRGLQGGQGRRRSGALGEGREGGRGHLSQGEGAQQASARADGGGVHARQEVGQGRLSVRERGEAMSVCEEGRGVGSVVSCAVHKANAACVCVCVFLSLFLFLLLGVGAGSP